MDVASYLRINPKAREKRAEHHLVWAQRKPTVIASSYAKKAFVDHTVYDTTSILQFISKRFELQLLPGIRTEFGDLLGMHSPSAGRAAAT
jgi:phospholipase C